MGVKVGAGNHVPRNTRVFQLQQNPAQEHFELRRDELERLKGENSKLLKRIAELESVRGNGGAAGGERMGWVPRESWDNLNSEKDTLVDTVEQKEKRLLRLKQVCVVPLWLSQVDSFARSVVLITFSLRHQSGLPSKSSRVPRSSILHLRLQTRFPKHQSPPHIDVRPHRLHRLRFKFRVRRRRNDEACRSRQRRHGGPSAARRTDEVLGVPAPEYTVFLGCVDVRMLRAVDDG